MDFQIACWDTGLATSTTPSVFRSTMPPSAPNWLPQDRPPVMMSAPLLACAAARIFALPSDHVMVSTLMETSGWVVLYWSATFCRALVSSSEPVLHMVSETGPLASSLLEPLQPPSTRAAAASPHRSARLRTAMILLSPERDVES